MNIEVKDQVVDAKDKRHWWKGDLIVASQTVSFIFHPLFIPTYLALFLLYVNPYAFAGMDAKTKLFRGISAFMLTAFFPAFTVFLLWRLKFISSVFLRTQKERIIPYIAAMFFYFWIYYVSRNLSGNSPSFVWLMLGVFLSSIAALMANIYCKISMHAIAVGNMFVFFMLLALSGDASIVQVMLVVFLTGSVLSARLLISDHTSFEVYFGFLLGMIGQFIAAYFL